MKRILLLLVLCLVSFPSFSQTTTTTTYFLIRHAEKDRSDATNKNPHLSAIGFKRALKWSQVFKDIKIDSVYTTNYNRTIETANPTAASHHLKPINYNPDNIDYAAFKAKTKGKTILIVGHSNSIPEFVNRLIGQDKYKQIGDTNNANLYMVTIIGNTSSDLQLYIK